MTSRRNCARTGTGPGLSTTTGGAGRKLSNVRILHFVLGALLMFLLALPCAWAQPGRGEGPQGAPLPQGQNPNGMHIFIWAGLKSHGEGQHDYPQFLADWSKYLTERGAVVDGALHAPSSADLEHTDVVVIYKGDAGYLSDGEKAALDAYVKRGGGFVDFHDSLCGPDPVYFASLVGAGKKHGVVNYSAGAIHYTIVDKSNPIMKDMSEITIQDEAFYLLTFAQNPPSTCSQPRRSCQVAAITTTGAKSCRRCGRGNAPSPAASPLARSCGCRATPTPVSPTPRFGRLCSAASRGQERSPSMSC